MRDLTDKQIEDLVFQKYTISDKFDIENISEPERSLIAVYTAQGIIDNGGLSYFFESDFPDENAYTVMAESYRNIGKNSQPEAIEKVLAIFPNSKPHSDLRDRDAFLSKYFDELGSDYHPVVKYAEDILFRESASAYESAMDFYRSNIDQNAIIR